MIRPKAQWIWCYSLKAIVLPLPSHGLSHNLRTTSMRTWSVCDVSSGRLDAKRPREKSLHQSLSKLCGNHRSMKASSLALQNSYRWVSPIIMAKCFLTSRYQKLKWLMKVQWNYLPETCFIIINIWVNYCANPLQWCVLKLLTVVLFFFFHLDSQ